ncbi:Phage integrase family protein [Blastococcus mobilis]|uniref:Phage integrase family protein n=1 Tax=Blastococcus mobilis TaxID=1938746 RepID=A0A238ZTD0_9ACTN|nr:Phage integrase family protein [Blastococcus mobilis]
MAAGVTLRLTGFVPCCGLIDAYTGGVLARATVPADPDDYVELSGSAWRQTGFVFTTEFGDPCDPRNAFRALRVAAAKAGLPHAGLHTLRHSAASVMLTRGVPLKVVEKRSGAVPDLSGTAPELRFPLSG